MIVDTSAMAAILFREDTRAAVLSAMDAARTLRISAATLVELKLVAERRLGPRGRQDVARLLERGDIETAPFTAEQAEIATRGLREYGRGSGHPARLNLGDSYAYALAIETGEPLLYVGEDFSHTDVRSALRD